MDYFLPRVALIGSLLSTIVACTAGNYDLPACGDLEICGNGKDDDCDGIKDNPEICACQPVGKLADCPPRVGIFTKPTYPASRCTEQKQLCRDDLQLDICRGIDPIFEQCANKIDDDCDGEVDEADCVPCIDNQEQNIYDSKFSYGPNSKCKPEIQVCKDGRWVTKTAAIGPRANDTTCDGQDDDCDNILDEDATWTSLPLSKTFKKGELCYDINKAGICRTVGTVVCNAGASSCDS